MRVLVDCGNSGSGGYLRYLRGIFASPPADVEVVLLASPGIAAALGPLDPRVRLVCEPALAARRRSARLLWWWREFPKLVDRVGPDVVVHPGGLVRGRGPDVARVAVHHIMAPFMAATYRLYGLSRDSLRFLVLRLRLGHSFRRADGVIFLADYTRRVVSGQVRGLRRTTVVPNAVPDGFLYAAQRTYEDLAEPVSILCVSTLYLFKHQWNVVDAVADLREDLRLDLRVTFVGGGEPRARERLQSRIRVREAAGFATVLEHVAPESMPAHYADADLFVFPSADEAWPVTLGEAMGSGLPIACADRMAMPDILRDAGVYFDPEKPEEIAAALRRLLTDDQLRLECGKRAREYAADYTWDRSAEGVFSFLRAVAADRDDARPTRLPPPRRPLEPATLTPLTNPEEGT